MIRPVYGEELAECAKVIRTSFLTVAEEYGFTAENAPRFTAFATTAERLEWQYREERPMFVYVDEKGKIAGYYSLCLQGNQECELNNLCVLPEYRHREIGKKLLNHAFMCAEALWCRKIKLGIVEENTKLRKWYEGFGIVHTGTRKFDFFPFNCGYMEKTLGFGFLGTEDLKGGDVSLRLEKAVPGNPAEKWLPAYHFQILDAEGHEAGGCDLRIGYSKDVYFGGNIGYHINEPYRGRHYAGKACFLLFGQAKKHGMDYLVITCNPDNYPSRKTCEYAGGVLRGIVDLPEDNDMRLDGETQKCIYEFDLTPETETERKMQYYMQPDVS